MIAQGVGSAAVIERVGASLHVDGLHSVALIVPEGQHELGVTLELSLKGSVATGEGHRLGRSIDGCVLQQAVDAGYASSEATEKRPENGGKPVAYGNGGVRTPAGRPKGVRNKLTNLRDAVLEAFDQVGGTQYLARLANGTQSDRAAFVGLVSKVLPTQINANVEGGIQVQLSWLGQRNIGTTVAQPVEQVTQVIDLERDNGGKYRIKDPVDASPAGGEAPAAEQPTQQNDAGDAQGA